MTDRDQTPHKDIKASLLAIFNLEDPRIIRHQKNVRITLFTQYIVFFGIISGIVADPTRSSVASSGAFMILLGVVGLGFAKHQTAKLKSIYEEAVTKAEITRIKNMVNTLSFFVTEGKDSAKEKIDAEYDRFNELGALSMKAKDSLKQLERSNNILWFSELFFIAAGTFYSGFGEELQMLVKLIAK